MPYPFDTMAFMDLIQLKMPPERVALVADIIEQQIDRYPDHPETRQLREIQVWLRYRLQRWKNNHHDTTAD